MAILRFEHKEAWHSATCSDDSDFEQVKRMYLMAIDPLFKWKEFRRALLDSPAYPLSVALASTSPSGTGRQQAHQRPGHAHAKMIDCAT